MILISEISLPRIPTSQVLAPAMLHVRLEWFGSWHSHACLSRPGPVSRNTFEVYGCSSSSATIHILGRRADSRLTRRRRRRQPRR